MSNGNLLWELRTEAGISQRRLATHFGVSNTAVWLWERPDAVPTIERIEAYRAAFRAIKSPPLSELELRYAHGDR